MREARAREGDERLGLSDGASEGGQGGTTMATQTQTQNRTMGLSVQPSDGSATSGVHSYEVRRRDEKSHSGV